MPGLPWKPLKLFLDLDRRIDEAFAELIHKPWRAVEWRGVWEPAVDVRETAEEYFVVVDLPGVPPEEIEVQVEGEWLTVCGQRHLENWSRTGQAVRMEREHGAFCRRVRLDCPVDAAGMETRSEQGLLVIHLPKRAESKQ
jgi:HSP20 family protein